MHSLLLGGMIALFGISLISILVVCATFNHLLRIEVQRYPACWEADGSPNGYRMYPVPLSERKTWPAPLTTERC